MVLREERVLFLREMDGLFCSFRRFRKRKKEEVGEKKRTEVKGREKERK